MEGVVKRATRSGNYNASRIWREMVAQGGTGVKPSSGILLPNGVKAGTHRFYCRKTSFSVPGKPLVDALEIIRGEENYASRFISLMCEKERS